MYCSSFFFVPLHVQKSGILLDTSKTEPTNTEEIQAMQKTIKKALPLVSGQVGANFMQGGRFYPRGKILTLK